LKNGLPSGEVTHLDGVVTSGSTTAMSRLLLVLPAGALPSIAIRSRGSHAGGPVQRHGDDLPAEHRVARRC
jgi:hypothetical protein